MENKKNNEIKENKQFAQWQNIFTDMKRHPLSDFIHKYYGITMCAYDLDGNRKTSSSSSKFCHSMLHNPTTEHVCQEFVQDVVCHPVNEIRTTICPFGIVTIFAPIRHKNRIVGTTVCNNMVLEDSFIPAAVREKYHLRVVNRDHIAKLEEFLQILMNLVNISEDTDIKNNDTSLKELFKNLGLTRREQEVACLVLKGNPNKKIADALYVTEATVKSHVSSVLTKLNLDSRYELIERFGKR